MAGVAEAATGVAVAAGTCAGTAGTLCAGGIAGGALLATDGVNHAEQGLNELESPYVYQNGQNVLNSGSLATYDEVQQDVISGNIINTALNTAGVVPLNAVVKTAKAATEALESAVGSGVKAEVPVTGSIVKDTMQSESVVADSQTIGAIFEGGLYRSVPEGRNPLEIHPIFNTEKAIHCPVQTVHGVSPH